MPTADEPVTAVQHGLTAWCYDALATQDWQWDHSCAALRRSADIVWMAFDSNPAVFCNEVLAIQPIETFLAEGPPVGVPPGIEAAIREYLLTVRTPGPSTWLALACVLRGEDACRFINLAVSHAENRLDSVPVPGPAYAGLYGWPLPDPRAEVQRLLVGPGVSDVTVEVTVNGPPAGALTLNRIERRAVTVAVVATAGAMTTVKLDVDARRWPELSLT